MVSYTLLIVLGGCLLGAFQLAVGVAIGLWARKSDANAYRRGRNDMLQAGAIAKQLQALANEMSLCIGEHRSELEHASQVLTSDGEVANESIANVVANVIGDIVLCNQNLQAKLNMAEGRLQDQAVEIEAHISRSLTDALTGLPNRREFNERMEERMSAWNRRGETFSLVLLDVDHFKKLNDVYGHLAGDQVLAMLSGVLRTAIRREDFVARFGGEEFAVLLPNTLPAEAALVAEKVREAVAALVVNHHQQQIRVTISSGIAGIQPSEEADSLIQRADAALYAAKGAGRNCAFMHDGAECRLAAAGTLEVTPSAAARLVELINSPDATKRDEDQVLGDAVSGIKSYLPSESISAALAETCQELRRFLEKRGGRSEDPVSPASQA
jgi:diguanylate cyclase